MSFPRYPAYKPSGVEWLGEVPEHWQVKRVRRIFEIKKRIAGELGFDILSITQQGIKVRDPESNDGQVSMDYSKYQVVEPGDFAMNHMDLLTGYVDISGRLGVTSPDYRVFSIAEPNGSHPGYLLNIFQMGYKQKILYAYGQGSSQLGRWRLPTEEFQDWAIPFPSLEEQASIGIFLDHETAKIDALIAEQQRLIELLQEKRQAVISHAVTKGLNPDAPMKDSGVEWLGEVPVHWVVCNFQRFVQIAEGQVDPRQNPYADMPLIAPNHIQAGTGQLLGLETAAEQGAESGKYICNEGDVIYSKIRPSLRKACIAPCACLTSADMYPLRAHGRLSNEFLFRFLLSEQFSALAIVESERVAMPKINRDSLKSVALAIPPKLEQEDICLSIRVHSRTFDALIAEGQEAIVLLSERRSALISAAVTGQIDVRGLVLEGEAA